MATGRFKWLLLLVVSGAVGSCWLTDEEALRQQKENYAKKQNTKIVRIKTYVEDGLNAALRCSEQAVTVKYGEKTRVDLKVVNAGKSTLLAKVVGDNPVVTLARCQQCSEGLRITLAEKQKTFSADIDLDWEELNMNDDYVVLNLSLTPITGRSAE